MYAIAKTTNLDDQASWTYMDAGGDFGRIEDARLYDDLETARGVARVMWWEARDEERLFVVDLGAGGVVDEIVENPYPSAAS